MEMFSRKLLLMAISSMGLVACGSSSDSDDNSQNDGNNAPVLSFLESRTLEEDTSITLPLPATDVDGDSLTYQIDNASSELGATLSAGNLTIAPVENFNGNGAITISVSDGKLSHAQSFSVTVTPVNDAPVIAPMEIVKVKNNSSVRINFSATDPEGDAIEYSVEGVKADLMRYKIGADYMAVFPMATAVEDTTITLKATDGDKTSSYEINLSIEAIQSFFSGNDGVNGRELWKTDGTPAGTQLVKDINTSGSSTPEYFYHWNDKVLFSANDGAGSTLWISDGTEAGTQEITNSTDTKLNYARQFAEVEGVVYFIAHTYSGNTEIWKTDGTREGTLKVHAYLDGNRKSYYNLTEFNNELYFVADAGGEIGFEVWRYDGSTTTLLKDINPGASGAVNARTRFVEFDGELCFAAQTLFNGRELWCTDGSEEGTALAGDISPAEESSSPVNFVVAGNHLYFTATSAAAGYEPYRYDGNSIQLMRDIHSFPNSSGSSMNQYVLNPFVQVGNLLHFTATDGASTNRWEFDMTQPPSENNPVRTDDPADTYSIYSNLNGKLVYTNNSNALFMRDGNSITNLHNFSNDDPAGGVGSASYFSRNQINGYLLFPVIRTAALGTEPWSTNGISSDKTRLLNELNISIPR